jgi:hypothetical protein
MQSGVERDEAVEGGEQVKQKIFFMITICLYVDGGDPGGRKNC